MSAYPSFLIPFSTIHNRFQQLEHRTLVRSLSSACIVLVSHSVSYHHILPPPPCPGYHHPGFTILRQRLDFALLLLTVAARAGLVMAPRLQWGFVCWICRHGSQSETPSQLQAEKRIAGTPDYHRCSHVSSAQGSVRSGELTVGHPVIIWGVRPPRRGVFHETETGQMAPCRRLNQRREATLARGRTTGAAVAQPPKVLHTA